MINETGDETPKILTSCSGDLLLDVGFDQICLAWTDGRYELKEKTR